MFLAWETFVGEFFNTPFVGKGFVINAKGLSDGIWGF